MRENDTRSFRKQIKLTLHIGEEHNLYISSDINDTSELMYPAFQAALHGLLEIVHNSKKWGWAETQYPNHVESTFRFRPLYEYSNNILAFCAERGQGKTSAMLSFAEALQVHSPTTPQLAGLEKEIFYVLPPIDPTLLEEEDSVVEIVLSRLYHEFNQQLKHSSNCDHMLSAFEKENLLIYFQECMHGLRTVNRCNRYEDDFETLMQLSDCFEVKSLLYKILTQFFQLRGNDPNFSYLVIPLDDTDLQFQCAYKTLEEVRKYLSLPNIVILMATDLDQLRKLIIDHHLTVLEHAVAKDVLVVSEFQRMTAKYLDKLIPASHAIYLPTVRVQCEANAEILLDCGKGPEVEFQEGIISLMHQKTGIIFVHTNSNMHPLIPTTLRGLRQFYSLLERMEDCREPQSLLNSNPSSLDECKRYRQNFCNQASEWIFKREANLDLFENYLVNDWCSSKLSSMDWELVKQLQNLSPMERISQAAIQIRRIHKEELRAYKSKPNLDITQILTKLDEAALPNMRYFTCAIKTYLSIQFHRLALKGWRDSLCKWMVSGQTSAFVFHFPELHRSMGNGFVYMSGETSSAKLTDEFLKQVIDDPNKPLDANWLKKLSSDLINCLPRVLDASVQGMEWLAETVVIEILEFIIDICCSFDLQEEVRNFVSRHPVAISWKKSYQDTVHEYYSHLVDYLLGQCHLPIAGSLYGFFPATGMFSILQAESLQWLEKYLSMARAGNAKVSLKDLAAAINSYDVSRDTSYKAKISEEIDRRFQLADEAIGYLTTDQLFKDSSEVWKLQIASAWKQFREEETIDKHVIESIAETLDTQIFMELKMEDGHQGG